MENNGSAKDKILKYLTEQLEIKEEDLRSYEGPITESQSYEHKSKALQIRNSIYDLKTYISVIKLL